MEPGHALVCGAGIAGPATAYWLNRHGWDTTVIEPADGFRSGGQNIDVRGAAREVIRRMGLEDAARQHGTGEKGTQLVDERGHHLTGPTPFGGEINQYRFIAADKLSESLVGAHNFIIRRSH